MSTRPATYADLLPASKVLAKAFRDEFLLGQWMHPHNKEYPDDLYLYFLHKLRTGYVGGPGNATFVSYKTNADGKEQITGLAHWQRKPPSSDWYTTSKVKAMEWYNYLESFVYPNRAADPSRLGILGETWPFMEHFWTGSRAEVWDLALLGVDPDEGGQGFGKALVKWGFEKAKQEGVGCSVVASDGKEGFYKSCGFEMAGTVRDEGGEKNPMVKNQIIGGAILFWDNERDTSGVKKYGEK